MRLHATISPLFECISSCPSKQYLAPAQFGVMYCLNCKDIISEKVNLLYFGVSLALVIMVLDPRAHTLSSAS